MGVTPVPTPASAPGSPQRPGDPAMTADEALAEFYKQDSISGDVLGRSSSAGMKIVPASATAPKFPVTVTTDGAAKDAHVSTNVDGGAPKHYENGKPAAQKSAHVTSKEMLGGTEAASDVAGRKDLQQALPPEVMQSLKTMMQNGHALIIEHSDTPSAPIAPKGAAPALQK